MFWKLWMKEKSYVQTSLEQLREQLSQVIDLLNHFSEEMKGNSEQVTGIAAQVSKVARLQYKTGQDLLGKLERLNAGVDDLQRRQDVYDVNEASYKTLELQINFLVEVFIHLLDDIDLVSSRLQGEGQEVWRHLLNQWARQILMALKETGIRELDILGHSFNPQLAEAIGAVDCDLADDGASGGENVRPLVPYEVVEVVKRGFAFNDGRLLRKAQVITRKEKVLDERQ